MKKCSLRDAVGRRRLKEKLIAHLLDDVLGFWTSSGIVANKNGNFPTFVTQCGVPVSGMPRYTRMQGRLSFAFLSAYNCLKRYKRAASLGRLKDYGLAGVRYIESLTRENGAYHAISDEDGVPIDAPLTIQDISYAAMPLIPAYIVTEDEEYINRAWNVIGYVLDGPYSVDGCLVYDSICSDGRTPAYFEGGSLNLVSVLDFLNVLFIPAMRESPEEFVTEKIRTQFVRLVEFLCKNYLRNGVFRSDFEHGTDFRAKHTDFGHTAKGYLVLMQSESLVNAGKLPSSFPKMLRDFARLILMARDSSVGWKTEFTEDGRLVREEHLTWWRHILVNQALAELVARKDCIIKEEMFEALENGIDAWFSLGFCDTVRRCRGIREGVPCPGTSWTARRVVGADWDVCKGNKWKGAYHETDHVVALLKLIRKLDEIG